MDSAVGTLEMETLVSRSNLPKMILNAFDDPRWEDIRIPVLARRAQIERLNLREQKLHSEELCQLMSFLTVTDKTIFTQYLRFPGDFVFNVDLWVHFLPHAMTVEMESGTLGRGAFLCKLAGSRQKLRREQDINQGLSPFRQETADNIAGDTVSFDTYYHQYFGRDQINAIVSYLTYCSSIGDTFATGALLGSWKPANGSAPP